MGLKMASQMNLSLLALPPFFDVKKLLVKPYGALDKSLHTPFFNGVWRDFNDFSLN